MDVPSIYRQYMYELIDGSYIDSTYMDYTCRMEGSLSSLRSDYSLSTMLLSLVVHVDVHGWIGDVILVRHDAFA